MREREAGHVVSPYTARCCVSEQSKRRAEGREGGGREEEEGALSVCMTV